ncbi:MAG: EamA family transporter [Neptunomonas phycophila]|uniref:EamA family transporter n=1 Tax=Neptunomonas phycophila TaxID=1572645 RepID=UPI003B8B9C10
MIAIAAGLLAVICQSIFYIFVRRAQVHLLIPGLALNVQMHWQLGFVAWPLAYLFWPDSVSWQAHLYALGVSVAYWIAQICFFSALNRASSAQVAPMLALKLMVVGIGSSLFLNTHINIEQWQAIALATAAAAFLSIGAGKPPLKATLLTLTTVVMFSASDISLGAFINAVSFDDQLSQVIFVLSYCFGLNSLFTLFCRPWRMEAAATRACIPVAALCLISMVFLFTAFVLGGVVLGNLMLATRGIVAVLVGIALRPLLEEGIEPTVEWRVWARRLIAAAGMLVAVNWYITAMG